MKKMLLLGDSINLHYGPNLKGYLADEYDIQSRPGEKEALQDIDKPVGGNGGDSSRVLDYIKELEKKDLLDFDLLVFNCGLHDIKRVVPEENYQVTVDKYEENINSVYKIMQSHGIKCVFITTTPVLEKAHNVEIIPAGVKRYNSDVCLYNEVAVKTAKKYDSPVIDLYNFVENLTGEKYLDYAHFNYEVRKLQAAFIAGAIRSID
ncbi:MAG: SGNH/GDSL hydrolase family protein [Clostridia bacterium]|nr:SGNH/GDSL hydrolase family protein [Clostridia bacterium]